MPEYIELMKEDLDIRSDVANEVATSLVDTITEASGAIGDRAVESVLAMHMEAEVQRRLSEATRERRRAAVS